jgi:hypothetical protein
LEYSSLSLLLALLFARLLGSRKSNCNRLLLGTPLLPQLFNIVRNRSPRLPHFQRHDIKASAYTIKPPPGERGRGKELAQKRAIKKRRKSAKSKVKIAISGEDSFLA